MTNRDYLENSKSDKDLAMERVKHDYYEGYYGDFNGYVIDYWEAVDREIAWLNEKYYETSTKKD